MLYLYKASETKFEWNGDPIHHAYDSVVDRHGEFFHDFKVLLDEKEEYKKIKRGMIVTALTPDGRQPFRIWEISQHEDHIEVSSLHVLYDLSTKQIDGVSINNAPLGSALEQFKGQLPKEMADFTFSTDIPKSRTFNTKEDRESNKFNALEVFMGSAHSIVGTWEAEIFFNGFDIRLLESVGRRTNALLYEYKNISNFENEESNKDLCTRIYAKSTYRPEREDKKDLTGDGNEDREYKEPEEIVIETIVDSPLINEYEQVHEKAYVNNNCKTEEELIKWAKRKFTYEKIDLPKRKVTIETNIIDGTEINYGDTLVLKYVRHNIDEEIRCVGYEYDGINGEYIKISLGSNIETVGETVRSAISDMTNNETSNLIKSLVERETKVMLANNGYNRIAFGDQPVPNPIKNDTWFEFKPNTPNQVTIKRFDGERWVIVMDDFFSKRIEEQLNALESKLTEVNQSITQTDQETQSKLDDFKKQLEALGLPDEDITRTLEDLERKLDRTSTRSDFALELIGSDGVKRYNKNILDGEYKRTVTLKDETTDLVASGGFKKGQTYTISFEALCKLLERYKVNLKMTLPEFLKGKAIGHYNASIEHESNKLSGYKRQDQSGDSYVLAYEGNNTLTITGDWYKTQKHPLTVSNDISKPITLEYRDGLEDNLTDDLAINWATDNEVTFESSL